MPTTRQKIRPARRRPRRDLVELRLRKGLSREEFAQRIGVSRETIRLVEAGFVPGPRIQFAIAGAFGVDLLDLWPMELQKVPV